MTGIVLRGRPHPGPVRAAVNADADGGSRVSMPSPTVLLESLAPVTVMRLRVSVAAWRAGELALQPGASKGNTGRSSPGRNG